MLKWLFGGVVVLAAMAAAAGAAWWWYNQPLIIRHPEFGKDCTQLASEAEIADRIDCVRVWYGTNRKIETADTTLTSDTTDVIEGTGESGDELRVGRADIWLPKLIEDGGKRARGETPHAQGRAPTEADKLAEYVFLTRITTSGQETFTTTLQSAIDDDNSNAVLLFVHGFNVDFDEALVRTAQLSHDLSRNDSYDVGTPVLFSWPSVGEVSLEDYQGDRSRSLAAAPYLEEFLDLLTEDIQVERINIIAHSMGNRVLTQGLENYARDYLERHNRDDLEFRILLVAADVERDIFAAANGVFDNLDANVTIYTSDTDRALHVSNIVNQKKRLGDTDKDKPFIRAAQHYQTIDATAVTTELFGTGHNYYSDNPTILWDMMCTIGETRPQDRALEVARWGGDPNGDQYYRVSYDIDPTAKACTLHRSAFPAGARIPESSDARKMTPVDETKPGDTRSLTPTESAPPPPAPAMPDPVFESQSAPLMTTIYIADRNSLDLTPYQSQLEDILLGGAGIAALEIRVHTDTVGSASENQVRSTQLAEAVRNWFAARGTDLDVIIATGLGETEPAILTGDEVDEPLNRRIEITVQYGN